MHEGRFVFAQLMDSMPCYKFNKSVERYHGNHRVRTFSCYDQFLTMAFAQLTQRESLRDIAICLMAMQEKLYHVGFRCKIAKSTLADAKAKMEGSRTSQDIFITEKGNADEELLGWISNVRLAKYLET